MKRGSSAFGPPVVPVREAANKSDGFAWLLFTDNENRCSVGCPGFLMIAACMKGLEKSVFIAPSYCFVFWANKVPATYVGDGMRMVAPT